MPDNQYPVFDGGQTLTAADLNQLRAFTNGRSTAARPRWSASGSTAGSAAW